MNTLELQLFLKRYYPQPTKIIVCAIDELPRKKLKNHTNYGIVVNLSKKSEPGSHWIALFIDRWRHGFYCDSYGFRARSWYLTEFIKKNCRRVEYCGRQLQQIRSNVCGMYAACFIIHMSKGYPYADFIDKFSKNLLINDHFIVKIFNYYRRNKIF